MRKVLLMGRDGLLSLRQGLEREGYEVLLRMPGEAPPVAEYAPDAIIVETAAGAEHAEIKRVLEESRTSESAPVIAMVEPDQLPSFDPTLGWDDFLLTTGSVEEVSLRVRHAIWRRTGVDAQKVLRCGDLEIDLANYTVHLGGQPVELTYKEYELLRFLASNADRVFTRETLLNKVWGYDFYGGARTVDVHVRRLRAKIEDRHHTFIETVRNVGYRFRAGPAPYLPQTSPE